MVQICDLTGLNLTDVASMPIVSSTNQVGDSLAAAQPVSLAGSRHSQGGQTVCHGGAMLITETMSQVLAVSPTSVPPTITVQAGATWSAVHHKLNQYGLAPLVHQSSPSFSVGGSLSVNCHGRDPNCGPLSSTVRGLKVMLPNGDIKDLLPEDDLCRAVLGGYGSCAVILEATLEVTQNWKLEQQTFTMDLTQYQQQILERAGKKTWPAMHYAWLNFDPDHFYSGVLSVDHVNTGVKADNYEKLEVEAWATTEAMRAVWDAARNGKTERTLLWNAVKEWFAHKPGTEKIIKSRMNWMRSAIGFTLHKGKEHTDLLQEYFVPLDQFAYMARRLKDIFEKCPDVSIMSTTIRIVQQEPGASCTFLSYCPNAAMVCFAVDMNVKLDAGSNSPTDAVKDCMLEAIAVAREKGGTFYLPYYRFADKAVFDKHYGVTVEQKRQGEIIKEHNSNRKLDNAFLQDYFR